MVDTKKRWYEGLGSIFSGTASAPPQEAESAKAGVTGSNIANASGLRPYMKMFGIGPENNSAKPPGFNGIGAQANVFAGAKAGVVGRGPDFTGAKGNIGAGAKAAANVHGNIGPLSGRAGASGMAGAGIGADGDISFKDGKFHVGGKMFAALGYGGSLSANMTAAKAAKEAEFKRTTGNAATALVRAMDGLGTDEKAIFAALKGKSAEEIVAIKAAYKAASGRALDDDLTREMDGAELKEAKALLARDPVQSKVAALQNAMAGWGTNEKKVKETLASITDPEMKKKVIAEYEKATGERLDKVLAAEGMEKEGINPGHFKVDSAPGVAFDPKQVAELAKSKDVKLAASALLAATDRWGSDETAIANALRGKSVAEIAAIKVAFKSHSGGKELADVLEAELSGTELKEAKALMSGDPVQAAVAQLQNSATGLGTNTERMHATLKDLTDPALRKQVKAEYEKQTGDKLDDMLTAELSGFDKDKAKAYLGGNKAEIAAVAADEAMHGGFIASLADATSDSLGIDRKVIRESVGKVLVGPVVAIAMDVAGFKPGINFGADSKALYLALEACKDDKERQALKDEYKKRTGKDLMVDVDAGLSGKEKDVARFIMAGDKASAEAAKMAAAADGLGTDKQAIYDALTKAESKAQRDAMIKRYNELYGKNGETFDKMIEGELDKLDATKATQLAKSGKMEDGFALYYAMNEGLFGPDEAQLKLSLQGKSKAEIAKLKAEYAKAAKEHGGVENADLEKDILGETSGRDGHVLRQSLKGNPTTLEEMRQRAKEDHEFERKGSSWVGEVGMAVVLGPFGYARAKKAGVEPTDIANGIVDSWSGAGKRLDQTNKEVEERYAEIKKDPRFATYDSLAIGSPERAAMDKEMMKALQGSVDWQEGDLKGFQEAKDAAADVASTAVAIAVGAVVTLASGGTAAPAVVVLLAGLANVSTQMLIRGGSMSNEAVVTELAKVIAESCAAGIVRIQTINALTERVGGLAGASNRLVAKVVKEAVEEAIETGSEEVMTALLDPSLYKGDINDWAMGVAQRTGKAMVIGSVAGGVASGVGGKLPDPSSWQGRTLKAGGTQMIGSVVTTSIDPNADAGSVEEKWTRAGRTVGEAGLRGMRDSLGGGNAGHTTDIDTEVAPATAPAKTSAATITAPATTAPSAASTASPEAAATTTPSPAQPALSSAVQPAALGDATVAPAERGRRLVAEQRARQGFETNGALAPNVQTSLYAQGFDGFDAATGDVVKVVRGAGDNVHFLVGDMTNHASQVDQASGRTAAENSVLLHRLIDEQGLDAVLAQGGLAALDEAVSSKTNGTITGAMTHLTLNQETGVLKLEGAMDTVGLVVRNDGTVHTLENKNAMFGYGMIANDDSSFQLTPGDRVIVISDGVWGRFGGKSEGAAGMDAVKALLADAGRQGKTVEQIVEMLKPQDGQVRSDDETALGFQWRAPGETSASNASARPADTAKPSDAFPSIAPAAEHSAAAPSTISAISAGTTDVQRADAKLKSGLPDFTDPNAPVASAVAAANVSPQAATDATPTAGEQNTTRHGPDKMGVGTDDSGQQRTKATAAAAKVGLNDAIKAYVAARGGGARTFSQGELMELVSYLSTNERQLVEDLTANFTDRDSYPERPAVFLGDPKSGPSIWLLGWRDGDFTPVHDHGASRAAVHIFKGPLEETVYNPNTFELATERSVPEGKTVPIPAPYIHRMGNSGTVTPSAVSIHAYDPPLQLMDFYEVVDGKAQFTGKWEDDEIVLARAQEARQAATLAAGPTQAATQTHDATPPLDAAQVSQHVNASIGSDAAGSTAPGPVRLAPIDPQLRAAVDGLSAGGSHDLGARGGKDGLVAHLLDLQRQARAEGRPPVEYGIMRVVDPETNNTVNHYVVRGGVDDITPRSNTDRLVFHNHPQGSKRLSPDDVRYIVESSEGRQGSTLLGTEDGGVTKERLRDYDLRVEPLADPAKGPIRAPAESAAADDPQFKTLVAGRPDAAAIIEEVRAAGLTVGEAHAAVAAAAKAGVKLTPDVVVDAIRTLAGRRTGAVEVVVVDAAAASTATHPRSVEQLIELAETKHRAALTDLVARAGLTSADLSPYVYKDTGRLDHVKVTTLAEARIAKATSEAALLVQLQGDQQLHALVLEAGLTSADLIRIASKDHKTARTAIEAAARAAIAKKNPSAKVETPAPPVVLKAVPAGTTLKLSGVESHMVPDGSEAAFERLLAHADAGKLGDQATFARWLDNESNRGDMKFAKAIATRLATVDGDAAGPIRERTDAPNSYLNPLEGAPELAASPASSTQRADAKQLGQSVAQLTPARQVTPADLERLLRRPSAAELAAKAMQPDIAGSLATPAGLKQGAELDPPPPGMIRLVDGSLAPAVGAGISPEARAMLDARRAARAGTDSSGPRKVVVDGGGPTGVLAALQAFHLGHDVTIVEAREAATLPILWNNRPGSRDILKLIDPVLEVQMFSGGAGDMNFSESVRHGERTVKHPTLPDGGDVDRATSDPRTIAAESSSWQSKAQQEVTLYWDRLHELEVAEQKTAAAEGREPRLKILRGYEVMSLPADGQRRGVVVQKVEQRLTKMGADGKPERGPDGTPISQTYDGGDVPTGWKLGRGTDGKDLNLGVPDDLLIADGAGSKARKQVGAESVDVGPANDYIAGYLEGVALKSSPDAEGNQIQGGSRLLTERDSDGRNLNTVAGTHESLNGTWALPQVDPNLKFDDPASIEAYFGRPMSKADAVKTYYKQQVAKVLEVSPADIPDTAFAFGPGAFTLQSHVTGPVANDASNVHLIGDARGNSHFFASLGKVTGTGTHQMALRQYWQAVSWGLDPDFARALLDRRLDAGSRVWLKSGLPDFTDPNAPVAPAVAAANVSSQAATDATPEGSTAEPAHNRNAIFEHANTVLADLVSWMCPEILWFKQVDQRGYLMQFTDGSSATLRIERSPYLEGDARLLVNPTSTRKVNDRPYSTYMVEGQHVIQINENLAPGRLEAALGRELGRMVAEQRLMASGRRPDGPAEITPADAGHIVELQVLAVAAARGGAPDVASIQRVLRDLAIVANDPASASRLQTIEAQITSSVALPIIRDAYRRLPAEAATHQPAATPAARATVDGSRVDRSTAQRLAAEAGAARMAKSTATLAHYRALQATMPAGRYPRVASPQIGGSASLAGRDASHLLIDSRGRWHEQAADAVQSASQMRSLKDLMGDPFEFAAPHERVPREAVQFWTDTLAARGDVINGTAQFETAPDGRLLLHITPEDGSAVVTVEVDGVPIIGTGAPEGAIPGVRMARTAADRQLRIALTKTSESAELSTAIRDRARAALAQMGESSAAAAAAVQADPDLKAAVTARGADPALGAHAGIAAFEAIRAAANSDGTARLVLGDESNHGQIDPMAASHWVMAGSGAAAISAAEQILLKNPVARVTMVGASPAAGAFETIGFRKLVQTHGDAEAAAFFDSRPGDGRFTVAFDKRIGTPRLIDQGDGKPPLIEAVPDAAGRFTGDGYVTGLGRPNEHSALIRGLVDDAEARGVPTRTTPLLDETGKYLGYRVEIDAPGGQQAFDVIGAASHYPPSASPKTVAAMAATTAFDSPSEIGNFNVGLVPLAQQADRYHRWRERQGATDAAVGADLPAKVDQVQARLDVAPPRRAREPGQTLTATRRHGPEATRARSGESPTFSRTLPWKVLSESSAKNLTPQDVLRISHTLDTLNAAIKTQKLDYIPVFGYWSLRTNNHQVLGLASQSEVKPGVNTDEGHLADHAVDMVASTVYRGTPKQPGLVAGLGPKKGEQLAGTILRIPLNRANELLPMLFQRELFGELDQSPARQAGGVSAAMYMPVVRNIQTEDGRTVPAMVFVTNATGPKAVTRGSGPLAGDLTAEKLAPFMEAASDGKVGGPAVDYWRTGLERNAAAFTPAMHDVISESIATVDARDAGADATSDTGALSASSSLDASLVQAHESVADTTPAQATAPSTDSRAADQSGEQTSSRAAVVQSTPPDSVAPATRQEQGPSMLDRVSDQISDWWSKIGGTDTNAIIATESGGTDGFLHLELRGGVGIDQALQAAKARAVATGKVARFDFNGQKFDVTPTSDLRELRGQFKRWQAGLEAQQSGPPPSAEPAHDQGPSMLDRVSDQISDWWSEIGGTDTNAIIATESGGTDGFLHLELRGGVGIDQALQAAKARAVATGKVARFDFNGQKFDVTPTSDLRELRGQFKRWQAGLEAQQSGPQPPSAEPAQQAAREIDPGLRAIVDALPEGGTHELGVRGGKDGLLAYPQADATQIATAPTPGPAVDQHLLEGANGPSKATSAADATAQGPEVLVGQLASNLHEAWRAPRLDANTGMFEPRVKGTKDQAWIDSHGGKAEVDIANSSYAELPSDWQRENKLSAESAMSVALAAKASGRALDAAFIELASEQVHIAWLDRNGAWAPADQKLPYAELTEVEKEKDRVVVRAAIEVLEGANGPSKATSAADATAQGPEVLVGQLASNLHEAWRAPRLDANTGMFEPRVKGTKDQAWIDSHGGKAEVDIANSSYAELPSDWQRENKLSAESAMSVALAAKASGRALDAAFIELASEQVHIAWLDRNGAWAPADQKLPYAELTEVEKEKDRVVVRAAIEVLEGANGPSKATSAADATAQGPEVLVGQLASNLHEAWRAPRLDANTGMFEPRVKGTKDQTWIDSHGGKAEVDIANSSYAELPSDWQRENKLSAESAMSVALAAKASGRALDAAFIELASEQVHIAWLDRNGAWAPADQKLPYAELTEVEKEKDRVVVRAAIEVLEGANGPSKATSAADATAQGPEVLVGQLASNLHEAWRAPRLDANTGMFEPRVKGTKDQTWIDSHGGKAEVDIANSSYAELPSDWQRENKLSAESAMSVALAAKASGRALDAAFIELASEQVHIAWLDRNGAWAPADQKLPYAELTEVEKEKDRVVVRAAIEVLEGANGPSKATSAADATANFASSPEPDVSAAPQTATFEPAAQRRNVINKHNDLTASDFTGLDDPRLHEIADAVRAENRQVVDRVRAALKNVGVEDVEIQFRAKSLNSILGKLKETPGTRVKDIWDFSGIRINITRVSEANFAQYQKIKLAIQHELGISDSAIHDYNTDPNPWGYTGRVHLFGIGGAEIYSEIQVGSKDLSEFIEKRFTMPDGKLVELHDLTGYKGQLYGKAVPPELQTEYATLIGKITVVNKGGTNLSDVPAVKAEVDAYFAEVQAFLDRTNEV